MPESPLPTRLSRRAVVAGAGAIGAGLAVVGCSSTGTTSSAAPPAAAGTALGPTSAVPVGSAKIFADQAVVVTQAEAGNFAAYSTNCPHQGCAVGSVEGANIVCPCHGSIFALDGSVTKGPAQTGLETRAVTVAGDQITLA